MVKINATFSIIYKSLTSLKLRVIDQLIFSTFNPYRVHHDNKRGLKLLRSTVFCSMKLFEGFQNQADTTKNGIVLLCCLAVVFAGY